jgi:hypothetical protein
MPASAPTTHPADASLVAAAQAALAATAQRTVIIERDGESYVAKRVADRPRRLSQALLLRWLVKRATGQALPMRTLLLSDAALSVGYEAHRLASLALAGERVPQVVHHGAGYLLLEHCGATVATLLEAWPAETWRLELQRLADELGAFHRAGQWHGAAQIKNLTRRGGQTYRIDFEENFGELVPLPAAQALDLVLFLNSVSLAGPIVEAEARLLLPRLVSVYFAANPDPQVREALARALPWIVVLARLASPFQRWTARGRQRKGSARLVILADTLRSALSG